MEEWSKESATKFETIDTQYTTLLINAEAALETHQDHPWSPILHRAYLLYSFWRKYNSARATNIKIQQHLHDIHLQLQDDIYMGNKYRHPRRQLNLALKQWRQCKLDSQALRDDHLTTRQELSVLAGNTEKTKAIKTLKRNERKNRMYRIMKSLNKPHQSNGGLSHVLTQDEDGTLHRIDDVDEMNDILFRRNRVHFAQADELLALRHRSHEHHRHIWYNPRGPTNT